MDVINTSVLYLLQLRCRVAELLLEARLDVARVSAAVIRAGPHLPLNPATAGQACFISVVLANLVSSKLHSLAIQDLFNVCEGPSVSAH